MFTLHGLKLSYCDLHVKCINANLPADACTFRYRSFPNNSFVVTVYVDERTQIKLFHQLKVQAMIEMACAKAACVKRKFGTSSSYAVTCHSGSTWPEGHHLNGPACNVT